MGPVSVSAVVVHYRGAPRLPRCIDSCLSSDLVGEVLVVDNEGIGVRLRGALPNHRIRILEMARNVGYGTAANVGLSESRGEGVLVLNQDTVLEDGAVEAMAEAAQDSGAWIVGPTFVGPDGGELAGKEAFPPPLAWQAPATGGQGWRFTPWVAGAAMLFAPGHTDLRFDERLFMFAEDEELCWRVWQTGGRVAVAEGASVVHEGGTATRARWNRVAITGRTVLNRARFVRWHRGWAAAGAYLVGAVGSAASKRLGNAGG